MVPCALVEQPTPQSEQEVFGYAAAMMHSSTADVWKHVTSFMTTWLLEDEDEEEEETQPAVKPQEKEPPAKRPRPPSSPPASSSAAASEQPAPWATFNRDPLLWSHVLKSHGCDVGSQQQLFLLAQHSAQGMEAASAAIAKILKKAADGVVLRNASAFLHKIVLNARNKIEGGWGPRGLEW